MDPNLSRVSTFRRLIIFPCFLAALLWMPLHADKPPAQPEFEEAVIDTGGEETDPRYHHGRLRHAVGVHRYQALRANRSQAPEGVGKVGWTYNHAPMLAYWRGRFWLNYVSNLVEEHGEPGRTGFITSVDGRNWEQPTVAFPVVSLPEIDPQPRYFGGRELPVMEKGRQSVMHQRMGFYTAPDGRLLTSGFYSYCPNVRWGPNRGQGLGRVVREVHEDGTLGPIFFIRYNRHAGWDESNTPFPFYTESEDPGFVEACEALLADKIVTLQWWEDDRGRDGFFNLEIPTDIQTSNKIFGPMTEDNPWYIEPKALSWYERPDGVIVGLWKSGLATLSHDRGKSWKRAIHNLPESGAKVWGQETADGRYCLVYCHSATERNRFPLAILTGEDGIHFDNLLAIHGEVPPMRYRGVNKGVGPQYIRGITPGNGTPPGDKLWLTYSQNKEDLWVSNVRLPVTDSVGGPVNEDFEGLDSEADLELWNLYIPKWAPVSIVRDPWDAQNHALQLADEDPYDYAKAERHIPSSQRVRVSFDVMQRNYGINGLEVEVHNARGDRAVRLWWFPGQIGFDLGGVEEERAAIRTGQWHRVLLEIDTVRGTYDVAIDDKWIHRGLEVEGDVDSVERLVFRTGPWRMDVRQYLLEGEPSAPGVWQGDLPGADTKVDAGIYLIDNVKTESTE